VSSVCMCVCVCVCVYARARVCACANRRIVSSHSEDLCDTKTKCFLEIMLTFISCGILF
jgi:hypothetical protein